jgi:transcriptional regulator with XRE-family HTH domain
MNSLSERIEARLKALGKNPSSVALEAGLGRSSVRDIIINGANPRLDTLRKLTGPLACSLDYLTGTTENIEGEPVEFYEVEPHKVNRIDVLEAGVFRKRSVDGDNSTRLREIETQFVYGDLRFPEAKLEMFLMGDDSLRFANILPGDLLTVANTPETTLPLRVGSLVVAYFRLDGPAKLSEMTARVVDVVDGDIVLRSTSPDPQFAEIRLGEPTSSMETAESHLKKGGLANWYAVEGGAVLIWGVVLRMTRPLNPRV